MEANSRFGREASGTFKVIEVGPRRWAILRAGHTCGEIFEKRGEYFAANRNGRMLMKHALSFEAALRAFGS
jgi:hypothetical protein